MRKPSQLSGLSKFAASFIKEQKRKEVREAKRRRLDSSDKEIDLPVTAKANEGTSNLLPETTPEDESAELESHVGFEWSLPTDTLVALKLMHAQYPKIEQSAVPPFVLRSQLYSSVNDRTGADRELEELKLQHIVRVFKLNSGKNDFGIMFTDDYGLMIEAIKRRRKAKGAGDEIAVFDWFRSRVTKAHIGASITHARLVSLLSEGGDLKENQISLLIHSGLLVRQLADNSSYWFGIPGIGSLLKNLTQGRKELTSFLARQRYKEMLQAALEERRLRTSQFDMRFHIRDLLGLGVVYNSNTTAGPLLRLSHD